MKRTKKLLVAFLAVVMCLALVLALVACNNQEQPNNNDDGDSKVTIKLAGETANASGEYSLTLQEGASKQYTLVVGTLTDYQLEATSSSNAVATATATATSLSVQAVAKGSAKITLSEKNGKANNLILNVSVTEVPEVEPTGLLISNLTEDQNERTGSGTLADPYLVVLADGKSSEHTLTVQPVGANNLFTWTVGTVTDDTFTASDDELLTATQNANKLSLEAGVLSDSEQEVYYVKGEASVGELVVYVKVTINKYVELEGITLNGLAQSQEDGYDYVLRTAKGTNWNLDKVAGRLTGGMGKGANERPADDHVSYYHSVNVIMPVAVPANATDQEWEISEEGDAGIFTANFDGSWSALKAGETVITITNGAGEASIKIKLIVEDTVYSGILKSVWDDVTAETDLDWYFDDHADNTTVTARSLLNKWYFSMLKTTSNPDGDDGNQKMFWLGSESRPYGFDLEIRLDPSSGAKVGDTIALAWTKATIPAGADKIYAKFASHSSDSFVQGRILLVKEDGTAYVVTGGSNGWEQLANREVEFNVPAACKGATVAVVIEARVTEANKNGEFQCLGAWMTVPITGITLSDDETEMSQGSTYQIEYTTTPSKVIDDSVSYTVTQFPEGGEGKMSISSKGLITVDVDAPTGEYVVTVSSTVDSGVSDVLTVTVTGYNRVTAFSGTYTDKSGQQLDLANAQISAKQGSDSLQLTFTFNENASIQTYTVSYKDNGSEEAKASSNIAAIDDGKLKFLYEGTVIITVTPDAEEAAALAITFTVTVRAGTVLNWGEAGTSCRDQIIGGSDPWNLTGGNTDVGEGADIQHNGSYLEKTIDVTDMDTLILYVRIFNGQQDGVTVEMEVKVGGQVIKPTGSATNAMIPETPEFDTAQPFYYDLSGVTGSVTIRITNLASHHCVIQQITIS